MKLITRIATTLLIVGGLNWGLVGFFDYDLVSAVFGGQQDLMSRIIYSLIGLSALYHIVDLSKIDRNGALIPTQISQETHFEKAG